MIYMIFMNVNNNAAKKFQLILQFMIAAESK